MNDHEHMHLIAEISERNNVDADVIKSLLNLERDFPDFTVFGSKTDFARRVNSVLNKAASELETRRLT